MSTRDHGDILGAVRSCNPISGLTHDFYRYPARFSPEFVRAAIKTFTRPGDCVVDPFMGGGTTIVEALSLGRRTVGLDINPLAVFIARVKSTPLSARDTRKICRWVEGVKDKVNLHNTSQRAARWKRYQKDVPWWIRKTLEVMLSSVYHLETRRQQEFVRCALLRTAQWALDCRKTIPSKEEFLCRFCENTEHMIAGAIDLRNALLANGENFSSRTQKNRRIINQCASQISECRQIPEKWLPPKLIITSPPYPGVHVLYHRWQVKGRRETAAPFWLANCSDGHGAAHYTFAARQRQTVDAYLKQLRTTFGGISDIMGRRSVIVQLVAFADPKRQLKAYLKVMQQVGLQEISIKDRSRRVWRSVPNRKWYANYQENRPASRELLLIHKKA